MKVNQDRRVKAGTLSLALEKYEYGGKYFPIEVKDEEIQLKNYDKPKESMIRSKSKDKNQRFGVQKLEQQFQDTEEDLFALCNNLTSRIQTLKKQKYDHVVKEYEKEERNKIQSTFQADSLKIKQKFGIQKKEIQNSKEAEKSKITRAFEDIKKFKQAYKTMLEALQQKKSKVEAEYKDSLLLLNEQKEKLITEWKRNSNQEILKLGFKIN